MVTPLFLDSGVFDVEVAGIVKESKTLKHKMATKSRFSATDVKAMVRDLRSLLLGQRVANVYNLTDKIYLFKFAIPGSSEKVNISLL
jgi:ABC-type sugar transport system substrate-binding protein